MWSVGFCVYAYMHVWYDVCVCVCVIMGMCAFCFCVVFFVLSERKNTKFVR